MQVTGITTRIEMDRIVLWKKITKLFSNPMGYLVRLIVYPFRRLSFAEYHISDRVEGIKMMTPSSIWCGRNVFIGYNARIEGVKKYNESHFTPEIIIGDGVSIQQNLHLTCATRISIGSNTAIAANVTITDINHPYTDIDIPIERQDIETCRIEIGEDCKIYNGAVILMGVRIGKHCVIGANSVVRSDIPDYSVAVGAPAKVVKRYDFETRKWIKV